MRGRSGAILFLVLTVVLTTLPARLEAAITTPFTTRFTANTNGSILLRGNANLTCPVLLLTPTCSAARNGAGSTTGEVLNNNGYPMVYTDTDGDSATFNDSTATVAMPPGSAVLFAGLYWGADPSAGGGLAGLLGAAAPSPSDKGEVLFRTPAGPAWQRVTASSLYTITANGPYQGFADVTALVAGAGDGVYGVADIQAGQGVDRYAGWTLAIAYQNAAEALRSLRVYDGFGSITSGAVSIPVTGFEAPHTGPVRAEVGAVAYEGDLGKTGDGLRLNGQSLTDAANPANNVFNSTVSADGVRLGGRNPNHANLLGVDIDQIDASGVLANAATSATLTMTTAGETYYPGVVTIAIDLYAPRIVTTTTSTDLNGGTLVPGDEMEYRIAVRNEGNDIADGVTLADAFPAYTTYVPGSLAIQGVPVTDAADGDGGQVSGGAAVFRLGSIPYLGTAYVTFRVKVALTVPAGYAITNLVNVSYTGRTTSVSIAAAGGATASPVLQPAADLSARLVVAPAFVQRATAPHGVTFTASVTNLGPQPEPAARARLTLPAGITPAALPSTCTAAGPEVTCLLGPLLAGHTAHVPVPASVASGADPAAVATLAATGTGHDAVAGNNSATATLAVNSPPQPAADSAGTTNGTPVTIPVLVNDTDPDNPVGDLTVSITAQPSRGAAVAAANGTVTYTPVPGWTGTDTFTYQVDDGNGGTGTATVTVTTANALPVANDDEINTPPGIPVVVTVLANDTDPNTGDPLTVVDVGPLLTGAGTVTRLGPLLTYTPDPGYAGRAHFTYTIQDSHGGQATGNVYVDVANSAPTAADDADATDHHTDVLVNVLANDTDPNRLFGDVLSIDSVGTPSDGTSTVGTATIDSGRIRYRPPAGFAGTVSFPYTIRDLGLATATATVTVTVRNARPVAADQAVDTGSGRHLDIDVLTTATDPNPGDLTLLRVSGTTDPAHGTVAVRPDGTIRYTPDRRFAGVDTFDFTIDDSHGGTDTGRITVTVANGLPVARPDMVTVQAGVPLTIDVMANDDDDPNGDPVTISVTAPPAHGTALAGPGRRITYHPAGLGADRFDYTLSDGHGSSTATVTIGVVNSAPIARPDSAATDTGTPVTVDVLANDVDPNRDALTLAAVTAAGHGTVVANPDGTLTYTPSPGFYGTDAIVYTVEDPARLAASAVLTVTVRNAAPVAVDDSFIAHPQVTTPLTVLANDHDPNIGQALAVAAAGPAAKGTVVLRPDGTVTYRSAPGSTGRDTFTYVLTDDLGRTDTGSVTIDINGPPLAVADSASTDHQTAVDVPVLANDTDPESDTLTVFSVGVPGGGTTQINPDGTVGYTPGTGFSGTDSFGYGVRDAVGNTASGQVSVSVAGAPPAAPSPSPSIPNPGSPPTPTPTPTVPQPSATDPEPSPTTPTPTGPTPTPTRSREPERPPAVPDKAAVTKPGAQVTIPLPAADLSGRPVTIVAVGTPANGTAVLNADGTVAYQPKPGFTGTDTFTYTVMDAFGNLAQATIVVQVGTPAPPSTPPTAPAPTSPPTAPNRAPTAAPDTVIVDAGGRVTLRPMNNDSDPDGDPLALVDVGRPGHGTAAGSAAGSITYVPAAGFAGGADSFTYTIRDGRGGIATGTVTVRVSPVRHMPVTGSDVLAMVRAGAATVLTGTVLHWFSGLARPRTSGNSRPGAP